MLIEPLQVVSVLISVGYIIGDHDCGFQSPHKIVEDLV